MFKCANCNLGIADSSIPCKSCGAIGVEHRDVRVFDRKDEENLHKLIEEGFEVFIKKRITEVFDEQEFTGFEYELQRPI